MGKHAHDVSTRAKGTSSKSAPRTTKTSNTKASLWAHIWRKHGIVARCRSEQLLPTNPTSPSTQELQACKPLLNTLRCDREPMLIASTCGRISTCPTRMKDESLVCGSGREPPTPRRSTECSALCSHPSSKRGFPTTPPPCKDCRSPRLMRRE